jgi:hypothetical protein
MTFAENLFEIPKIPPSENNEQKRGGNPRLKIACRDQFEIQYTSLDMLVDENNIVRNIWEYVDKLDL